MPWFGLGTFRSDEGEEVIDSVKWALRAGYRSIDTAAAYGNEAGVGQAIRESETPRAEVFVTTKVWNNDQGYDRTLRAFNASLEQLGMDYVDLYLIHWPVKGKYKDTWRALERIYEDGRARAIGVSNFLAHHIEDLMGSANVRPVVDQVEFHPHLQQPDLQAYLKDNDIQMEAWAPIMKGEVLKVPELVEIGRSHGKSAVQVTLRWMRQLGIVAIPKSVHKNRIEENASIFDFELSQEEMEIINGLDRHRRFGSDPDNFNF
jgi:diketogulonate reductase-like aldo/keto reductase